MLDFDSYQIEKDFAQNTIFQVKFALIEFEFNMQAFFYSHFHFNGSISVGLLPKIRHDKFFFLRYPIIVSIYHHVYVIAQPDYDSIIALKLLFYSIELKIVRHIVGESTRWF